HSLVSYLCHGDLRDLHSFPTRRSSDLNGEPIGNVAFLTDITDQKEIESERIRLAVEAERARAAAAHEDVHLQDAIKELEAAREKDRKSTRLNSSHVKISYAVFCLKKKT